MWIVAQTKLKQEDLAKINLKIKALDLFAQDAGKEV